jgi:ABC-type multidrug transport system fused ATPase/permease subunit
MAVRAALGPLNSINSSYLEIQRYRASAVRISELLDEKPALTDRADARPLDRQPKRIRFEHVSFAYEDIRVLDDISFEVESGETLGVVGPSGSGKTTLLCLAARLFDPSVGRVCLDGEDVSTFRLSDVYRLVALVPQEPFLFSASVRDNIRCAARAPEMKKSRPPRAPPRFTTKSSNCPKATRRFSARAGGAFPKARRKG